MTNFLHQGDLPNDVDLGSQVAVDCETMGLNLHRDRLCLVQLSAGNNDAHLVQIVPEQQAAPNLTAILTNPEVLKLFHFGRFDIAALLKKFNVLTAPVYCTKIASRLTRTNSDRHGLKNLCEELLSVELSKAQQSGDWGGKKLTKSQIEYAASDVLYLHKLKAVFDERLAREGRLQLAKACFDFLPMRAQLDVAGWSGNDIFAH